MRFKGFITFVLVVFVCGFIQSEVVVAILYYKGIPWNFHDLLRDGSYFFFSTTLVATSYFSLHKNRNYGGWDFVFSVISGLTVSVLAISGYSIEFSDSLQMHRPVVFSDNLINGQIGCLIISSLYSLYVGGRTGAFTDNYRRYRC